MFKFLTDTAASAVNFTCDTAEMAVGGDGPSREDVTQLLAAGLSIAAVAAATGLAIDVIENIAGE